MGPEHRSKSVSKPLLPHLKLKLEQENAKKAVKSNFLKGIRAEAIKVGSKLTAQTKLKLKASLPFWHNSKLTLEDVIPQERSTEVQKFIDEEEKEL